MKAGWDIKQLGEISKINYGYTESADFEIVGPKFLRITDIQNERVDWDIVPFCKIGVDEFPKYRLVDGDIVFARTGATTGKSYLVSNTPDAVFASYLIRLQLTNKSLLPEFVYLFFQTADYWKSIKDGSSGSTQGGFNATKLAELRIPYPPVEQQQRIVAILDQAFKGIAKARANSEQNLQNAHTLFESHLKSVFTQHGEEWIEARLEDCFKLKSGDGLTSSMMKSDGIYSVFGGNGIAGKFDKFNLSGSNVIIGRVGALCGNVRYILDNIWLTDNAFRVVDYKFDLDHAFLTYLLNYKNLREFARQAAQPVISNSSLKDVILNFPKSLAEQKTIVAKLDLLREETQRLEALYQRKITLLDELKKSLLQQAFAGEL